MAIQSYSIHVKPVEAGELPEDVAFVPEKSSYLAFLLGPIWAAFHGMWLVLILYLIVLTVIFSFVDSLYQGPVWLGTSILYGLQFFDLKRWTYKTRGYEECGVLVAEGDDLAAQRFYQLLDEGEITVPTLSPKF